jgi:hypothetical protein
MRLRTAVSNFTSNLTLHDLLPIFSIFFYAREATLMLQATMLDEAAPLARRGAFC